MVLLLLLLLLCHVHHEGHHWRLPVAHFQHPSPVQIQCIYYSNTAGVFNKVLLSVPQQNCNRRDVLCSTPIIKEVGNTARSLRKLPDFKILVVLLTKN